jgi:hypothetical protein
MTLPNKKPNRSGPYIKSVVFGCLFVVLSFICGCNENTYEPWKAPEDIYYRINSVPDSFMHLRPIDTYEAIKSDSDTIITWTSDTYEIELLADFYPKIFRE